MYRSATGTKVCSDGRPLKEREGEGGEMESTAGCVQEVRPCLMPAREVAACLR